MSGVETQSRWGALLRLMMMYLRLIIGFQLAERAQRLHTADELDVLLLSYPVASPAVQVEETVLGLQLGYLSSRNVRYFVKLVYLIIAAKELTSRRNSKRALTHVLRKSEEVRVSLNQLQVRRDGRDVQAGTAH